MGYDFFYKAKEFINKHLCGKRADYTSVKLSQIQRELENKRKLEYELLFERKRYERIKYLLNHKSPFPAKLCIEKTKKGINVLTVFHKEKLEIQLFNLDDAVHNEKAWLVLFAKDNGDSFFVQDIRGGSSKGHGELAMNHLIEYAQNKNKVKIMGDLSPVDYDHKDRLIAFYKKLGFKVCYTDEKSGYIVKSLAK